jgi:hypothetical protein
LNLVLAGHRDLVHERQLVQLIGSESRARRIRQNIGGGVIQVVMHDPHFGSSADGVLAFQ